MCGRVLPIVFLIMTLTQASLLPVRGCEAEEERPREEEITSEEAREALLVAAQFLKGFEERNNLLSVIDELYVKDFDRRLRPDVNDFSYIASVEEDVIESASNEDLRRFYAASLGFYYAGNFLYAVEAYKRKLAGDAQRDKEPPIHDLLPPGVIDVMRTDPLLGAMIAEAEEEERRRTGAGSGETEQSDYDASTEGAGAQGNGIGSIERLRQYVSTLEKANALIRAHLKTLPVPQTLDEMMRALSTPEEKSDSTGNDDCERMCPRVNILSQDHFGSPKGTRLICMKVLAFHMELVRVDGRLRILNVFVAD